MKLYPIPGGVWAGTEADFKKTCKARSIDPKTLRGAREVPTGKAELLEFLNFNAVDVYRTDAGTPPVARVDPAALQAEHNPVLRVEGDPHVRIGIPGVGPRPSDLAATSNDSLPALFAAAPIKLQAELVVAFIDLLTA